MKIFRERFTRFLSPGALVILVLAVVSIITALLLPRAMMKGLAGFGAVWL